MKNLLLTLLLGLACLTAAAQQSCDWEELYDELYAAGEESQAVWEENLEILSALAAHPVPLNTASREDLERIPFLTAEQIEELQAYVYRYHGMRTLGELALIESLDAVRRQLLPYFVCIAPAAEQGTFPSLKNILTHAKHTLLFTSRIPFYRREGDRNGYLGYPYAHSFRYAFRDGDYVQAGLVGAQDPGEPFFAHGNNLGYDHYSFYVLIRKMGRLKTLAAGRYRISFGQGLVINNTFGLGKTGLLTTLGRQPAGIRAHSSRSADGYLQGAAATVEVARHTDLTAFLSYRTVDAVLSDSGTVRTLPKNGYHRTEREMSHKDAAAQLAAGTHLGWTCGALRMGLTGVFSRFSRELTPGTSLYYRRYAPSGNDFWNVSVDYSYLHHRWSMGGETATDSRGNLATANRLSFQPVSCLSLLAAQRYYGYRYTALFARSSGDNASVQNESGLLVGAEWKVARGLSLMGYTDLAYFSHPRPGAHTASKAWDNLAVLAYIYKRWSLRVRYRVRIREKDNAGRTALVRELTQRGRLSLSYAAASWNFRSQIDFAASRYLRRSTGYMFTETGTWQPAAWLSLTATAGYFHTADFSSRIYVYERGPLYAFSFPAFYGRGVRCGLFARADLSRRLMLILRSSTTRYFDRDTIASGLQQISSSTMSDLDVQLRWKF